MLHNRKIIYLAGFLSSMSIALTAYINSSFLSSFVDEQLVGIIYTLGSMTCVLALLLAPKIFSKAGGYKFLLFISLFDIFSLLSLVYIKNSLIIILVLILHLCLNALIFFSLDEILKIFSKDSTTGKTRGTYLAICSLAWIIAQVLHGTILGELTLKNFYLASAIIMTLFFLTSLFNLKNIPDPKYDKAKIIKSIREFFKNKNLFRIYSINFLLNFFYSWMIIYTPIYLSMHLGFSWKEIGMMFSIMLVPFFLLPFHLGVYGDKTGERKMLMLGFAIASLATLCIFFIHAHSIALWATVLLITRIGAAIIEVMSDSYFFKHIKPENEELVGVYRSASPVAYIIGPLVASIIFIFVPSFNFIYLILGGVMLSGIYIASTIWKRDI